MGKQHRGRVGGRGLLFSLGIGVGRGRATIEMLGTSRICVWERRPPGLP